MTRGALTPSPTCLQLKSVRKEGSALATFEFQSPVCLGIKLAGVHWQYRTPSHGAELTAGYWNTSARNGYEDVFHLVHDFGGNISFTCVEMRDCEHDPDAQCSPEGLLHQIFKCSEQFGALRTPFARSGGTCASRQRRSRGYCSSGVPPWRESFFFVIFWQVLGEGRRCRRQSLGPSSAAAPALCCPLQRPLPELAADRCLRSTVG